MALTKKPVTGMKDITPAEMQIREYVMNQIRETYKGFGFSQIETPCVEHIENLTSKQGGDNEKLIFKILKRGDKMCIRDRVLGICDRVIVMKNGCIAAILNAKTATTEEIKHYADVYKRQVQTRLRCSAR